MWASVVAKASESGAGLLRMNRVRGGWEPRGNRQAILEMYLHGYLYSFPRETRSVLSLLRPPTSPSPSPPLHPGSRHSPPPLCDGDLARCS